jgi:hypothetical protein
VAGLTGEKLEFTDVTGRVFFMVPPYPEDHHPKESTGTKIA